MCPFTHPPFLRNKWCGCNRACPNNDRTQSMGCRTVLGALIVVPGLLLLQDTRLSLHAQHPPPIPAHASPAYPCTRITRLSLHTQHSPIPAHTQHPPIPVHTAPATYPCTHTAPAPCSHPVFVSRSIPPPSLRLPLPFANTEGRYSGSLLGHRQWTRLV